jgi:hypothetical protein
MRDKEQVMNRIIREHYPVDRLPDDLKAGLGQAEYVRVVIEGPDQEPTRERLLALMENARSKPGLGDDPVERIRKIRDQWDD